jgi:hypothetical protein
MVVVTPMLRVFAQAFFEKACDHSFEKVARHKVYGTANTITE